MVGRGGLLFSRPRDPLSEKFYLHSDIDTGISGKYRFAPRSHFKKQRWSLRAIVVKMREFTLARHRRPTDDDDNYQLGWKT